MTIPKELLIDFDSLKVGDTLWSARVGDVEITHLSFLSDFPIKVEDKKKESATFTKDGFFDLCDLLPTLLKSNPYEYFAKQSHFQEREMMVSNDNKTWVKRVVFMKKNDKFLAWFECETIEETKNQVECRFWKHAKEISPIKEYTMQELQQIVGHEFKIKE